MPGLKLAIIPSCCQCIALPLMLHFETHNIEQALAELTEAMSRYLHDRLIAPALRPLVNVTVRIIEPDAATGSTGLMGLGLMGLQRAEVLSHKQRGQIMPLTLYDFTLPRQNDPLDTIIKLSHEWVHVAQLASGRYSLTGRHPKPGKPEKFSARWLGVPIGRIDAIPYALRPWEQEAHEWQHKLVVEFIDRFNQENKD